MSEENSDPNSFKGKKSAVEWRRNIVLQRLAQGFTQSEIARELNLHRSTISTDYRYLNELSKKELRLFLHEKLPMEITQAFASYDNIIRAAWDIKNNTKDDKTKLQALHLIRETRESGIDLVSNVDIATKVMNMADKKSVEQDRIEYICPECRQNLVKLSDRQGNNQEWFCRNCSIPYLDTEEIRHKH